MASGAFTPKVRWQIIGRDSDVEGNPQCQWCGFGVRVEWGQYSLQHRRARGIGGSKLKDTGQPQNGVLVHGSATQGCHAEIESNPEEATKRGFRIPQGSNPASIPIRTWDGRLLHLTADGQAIESTDPPF